MSLIGVDIGSSGIRAAAFDGVGNPIAESSLGYLLDMPQPGFVEVNPEEIWNAFVGVIRQIASKTQKNPIEAISLSCHGETFFLVGKDGCPAAKAIMNSDNRAAEQAEAIKNKLGSEAIYDISGAPPHAMFPLAKLSWIKQHHPKTLANTAKIYCVGSYLSARMGLPGLADPSLASRTQLFDIHQRRWSSTLCEVIGLDAGILPQIAEAQQIAGQLSVASAGILGVPRNTPVFVGGHDQACAAVGLGVTRPGIVGVSAGTYECLSYSDFVPHLEPLAKISCFNSYCHILPNQYITLGFFPSGIMMRWFIGEMCGADETHFADCCSELELKAVSGPSGLTATPYLVGACTPHWDPHATASITGLNLSSTRSSVYRAILEGIARELAANLKIMEQITGNVQSLSLAGGGAKSPLGLRLRAAATGKVIQLLHTTEASCLGAAMLAGVGLNTFSDFQDAQNSMLHYKESVIPYENV